MAAAPSSIDVLQVSLSISAADYQGTFNNGKEIIIIIMPVAKVQELQFEYRSTTNNKQTRPFQSQRPLLTHSHAWTYNIIDSMDSMLSLAA